MDTALHTTGFEITRIMTRAVHAIDVACRVQAASPKFPCSKGPCMPAMPYCVALRPGPAIDPISRHPRGTGLIGIPQSRQLLASRRRPINSSEYETACWVLTGFLEIRIQPAGPDDKWASFVHFSGSCVSPTARQSVVFGRSPSPVNRPGHGPSPHHRWPSASSRRRPPDLLFSSTSAEPLPKSSKFSVDAFHSSVRGNRILCTVCVLISSNPSLGYEYGANSRLSVPVTPRPTLNQINHLSPFLACAGCDQSPQPLANMCPLCTLRRSHFAVSMKRSPSRLPDIGQLQPERLSTTAACWPRYSYVVGLGSHYQRSDLHHP